MTLRSERFKLVGCALMLVCLAAPASVLAAPARQQVYTWVDQNGVRHYADHPGSPDAVLVSLHTAAPMSVAGAASTAPPPASAPVPRTVPASPRATASAAERAALCTTLRKQVQTLQSARRVQVTENGKTRFVTGENLVKFRAQMQKRMQQACTPPRP